jgi:O-antigen ligase
VATILLVVPSSQHRLSDTLAKVAAHDQSDERYIISKASFNVVKENMPWGVGVGDRMDELVAEYQRMGAEKQYWRRYNPHNQFVDTLMTTGILGLLVLSVILILPAIDCIRNKNYLFLAFLFIVTLSALFESILERQMGINFFCFLYCLFMVESKNNTEPC